MLAVLAFSLTVAQTSVVHDFDSWRLAVPAKPGDSKQVNAASKVWEGSRDVTLAGKTLKQAMFSVSVHDLTKLETKPTSDQFLALHERNVRANANFAAPNFRTSFGKMGESKMVMLNGSVLAKRSDESAGMAYVVSSAFVDGDKAYESMMITFSEEEAEVAMRNARESVILRPDDKHLKTSGLPEKSAGDYVIAGLPFSLTFPRTPYADIFAKREDAFAAHYTAFVSGMGKAQWQYRVRQIKPEDKRSDLEILRAIAEPIVDMKEISDTALPIKDGSLATNIKFTRDGRPWKGRVFFEREGDWVAVLVSVLPEVSTIEFDDASLKRIKKP